MKLRFAGTALPLVSLLAATAACTATKAPSVNAALATSNVSRSVRTDAPMLARPEASAATPPARATPPVHEVIDDRIASAPPESAPVGEAEGSLAGALGPMLLRSARPRGAVAAGKAAAAAGGGRDSALEAPSPSAPIAPAATSPSIKAGEWDDNANYREFVRWLATESGANFHRVDVGERRFLVVRDVAGKAVPRCPVTVADASGHRTTLTTSASGRAILFPHAEGLVGRELTATAACAGSSAQAGFSLGDPSGVVDLKLATLRTSSGARTIDVAFILDTTGSMAEEILAVKSTVQKVAASLERGDLQVNVRVGMVAYKDRGDEYVTKIYPLTTDLGGFQRDVSDITASGGGDMPESVNEGIHAAVSGLSLKSRAVAQFAFLIGDAPPHLDYAQDFDYAAEMKNAAHRGIQIFTVAASGMDDVGQIVWRQVAEYTNATNLFVLRGGAGPQSTGAGDPKSSCGGTHDNYTSGQLDALILGKIRSELHGIDRDPLKIPGLLADENSKPCSERMLATRLTRAWRSSDAWDIMNRCPWRRGIFWGR